MFLQSSSVNPNQTMFKQLNTNETSPNPNPNPNPTPSPSPPFFFPFSTSLFTQENGSAETHFVSQALDNFHTLNDPKAKPSRTPRKRKSDDGENPNPRKRTGKSDRHSKIYTAQGPRDRRMRLSVHIARKFFDLQDMLGFDKASKTIEWLFCQSRAAIREVALNHESQISINNSSITNCENSFENSFELGEKNDCELNNSGQVSQAKESWDKARARARESPREKSVGFETYEVNPTHIDDLGFFGYLDQGIHFPIQEVGMAGNIAGADSSSNSIFDFDKDFTMSGGVDSCNFMGMFENLEVMVPLSGNYVQEQNPNSHSYYQV